MSNSQEPGASTPLVNVMAWAQEAMMDDFVECPRLVVQFGGIFDPGAQYDPTLNPANCCSATRSPQTEMFMHGDIVQVQIEVGTSKEIAVTLLRQIADWIERVGVCGEDAESPL